MNKISKRMAALCLGIMLLAGCTTSEKPKVSEEVKASESVGAPLSDTKIPLVDIGDYIFLAPFSHGYAFVSKSTECGYIDYEGNYTKSMGVSVDDLIKLDSATMTRSKNNPFPMSEEGFYPSLSGKTPADIKTAPWSIKNIKTGEALVENLPFAAVFNEGRAVVTKFTEDKTATVTEVIDGEGKVILGDADVVDEKYRGGVLTIRLGDSASDLFLVDTDGKQVAPVACSAIGNIPNLFGSVGYVRSNESLLETPIGQPIIIYGVNEDDKANFKFTDEHGSVIFSQPQGTNEGTSFAFDRNFIADEDTGLWSMYDKEGKKVGKLQFKEAMFFRNPNNTLALLPESEKWIAVNINGEQIGDMIFDGVCAYPTEDFLPLFASGRAGAVNNKGEVVIPFEHDWISGETNGFCLIKDGQNYILSTVDGKPVDGMHELKAVEGKLKGVLCEGFLMADTADGTKLIDVRNAK